MGRYHRYEQWEIDRIVKLHSVGHDVLEIASITGANKFSIYRILEKNGCKLNGNIKVTDEIRAGIENAIRSGAMEAQLCAQYNLSNTTIRTIRRQAGLRFANDARPVDAEQFAIEKIGQKNPDVTYVSGYVNWFSSVRVRFNQCGHETTLSFDYLVRQGCKCQQCAAAERNARREAEKATEAEKKREKRERNAEEARIKAEEREAARIQMREERRAASMHMCPVCGALTANKKYCGERCARRAERINDG